MTAPIHVLVLDLVDDPSRPSGGNRYVREAVRGLTALDWPVVEHAVPGPWPWSDEAGAAALERTLAGIPDHAIVLVDGLIASAAAQLVPVAARLSLVVLTMMPLAAAPPGHPVPDWAGEAEVLRAAELVIVPSDWTADRLVQQYAVPATRIQVVPPGADAAPLSQPSPSGERLLCVAVVAPHKGHDVLIDALAQCAELEWRLTCVGSLDRSPDFADAVIARAVAHGLADRIEFTGPLTGADLARRYAAADLFVSATLGETYGMTITEAAAHGVPAVVSAVGGVPEALGLGGELVPAGDPIALGAAVRRWLTDPDHRDRLRRRARQRRTELTGWDETANRISAALIAMAATGSGDHE